MAVRIVSILFIFQMCALCTCLVRKDWPGYEYKDELHGWYKVHEKPASWQNARINCHLEDAVLMSPWTEQFTSFIWNIMDNSCKPAMYSGALISFPEGVYVWRNGQPKLSLEPSDLAQVERCMVFQDGTTREGDCAELYPYVCYARASVCGPEDNGYKFSAETDHCYKLNETKVTWAEANATCQEEGGNLAVINSEKEAAFLVKLYKEHASNIYDSSYSVYKNGVAIGFYRMLPFNSWWTVDGQSLERAGYSTWYKDEPRGYSDYGYMYRDGTLYIYSGSLPFICEKKATLGIPGLGVKSVFNN